MSIKSDKSTAHVPPPSPIYFVNNFSKKVLTNDEYEDPANGMDFVYPSSGINEESFIGNIESYFINLMGYVTDKPTTYKMTPDQLLCASKLRSVYEKFRFNARKKSKKYQYPFDSIEMFKTRQSLSKDESIYITRPDIGKRSGHIRS